MEYKTRTTTTNDVSLAPVVGLAVTGAVGYGLYKLGAFLIHAIPAWFSGLELGSKIESTFESVVDPPPIQQPKDFLPAVSGDLQPYSISGVTIWSSSPSAAHQQWHALARIRLSIGDVTILPLAMDRDTDRLMSEALSAHPHLKALNEFETGSDPGRMTAEKFEQTLAESRGKLLVIIGHVEDGNFMAIGPNAAQGAVPIPLSHLVERSKALHTDVLALGCLAAKPDLSGSSEKPRSFSTATHVLEAAGQADSLQKFLVNLRANDIRLSISPNFGNDLSASLRPCSSSETESSGAGTGSVVFLALMNDGHDDDEPWKAAGLLLVVLTPVNSFVNRRLVRRARPA